MKYGKEAFTPLEIRKSAVTTKSLTGFTPLEIKERLLKTAKSLTGFTLIEITIALLILTVGLVGILALFPVGFDAAGRASHITTATFLAQEKIEDAKRLGYNAIAEVTTKTQFAAPYGNFDYQLTQALVTGTSDLKKVEVTVFWPSGSSSARSIVLTTYIAKYEP